ncbi:SGNH/GDSL hydrolase family protein [Desmospora profundinema]|uniref:Lysophospholipase L1-like esterase n=1 Tax=Desmospora profundinema TaxID=1571184 RepID=A0ABU1IKL5_9BACL|nr:GDSL-type esterase/lipase family protein [Desmospora profundinema]MDR6225293.1 lysophospholipase L1-like esterase [Desmospora profundinema]
MNPITYLALGDSLTEGVGASTPDRHLVAQYFEHIRNTDHCRVINMGISGLTSTELYDLVQSPGLHKLIPRASHITLTTGGCDFIKWYEDGDSLIGLARTMKRVVNQVDQLLSHLRQLNPDASMGILGFYMPLPAYEMGYTIAARALKTMNVAYNQLAKRHKSVMIDPFEVFLNRKEYFADEVHPNQQGYDVLARLLLKSLIPQNPAPSVQEDPVYS